MDGIGINLGIDIGNTSYDISANIGLGTLALVVVAVSAPVSLPVIATAVFIIYILGGIN